jgi:glycosyltransferase involved in cell wall biosynthesis
VSAKRVQLLSASANSQRAPRVVYDGLNVVLGEGTGIATYTRVLTYIARSLGYDIGILYGVPLPSTKDPFLQEVLFFDQMRARKGGATGSRRGFHSKFVDYISYLTVVHPSSLHWGNVVIKEQFQDVLPELDSAFFVRDLFDNAERFFRQTGRFVRISLETQPHIHHFTYPVPIKGTSGCNIYTIHDLMPIRLPFTTMDNKSHTLKLLKTVARAADHIVTVSENSRQDIIRVLGVDEGRVTNTYQAVNFPTKYLQRSEATVANFLEARYGLEIYSYLIFFGAMEPKKNIGRLIDGFLLSGVDVPLVLIMGRGWDNALETARLSEHRATPRGQIGSTIRCLDYVDRSTLVTLVKGARALIFPSLYEGFGLPVLEAMMLGTPVVTSAKGGLEEVAGEAALLVDPYDVDDIARGITAIVNDPDLRGVLRRRGVAQAAKFSIDRYRERVELLYASLR